jgi:hypothetical protein
MKGLGLALAAAGNIAGGWVNGQRQATADKRVEDEAAYRKEVHDAELADVRQKRAIMDAGATDPTDGTSNPVTLASVSPKLPGQLETATDAPPPGAGSVTPPGSGLNNAEDVFASGNAILGKLRAQTSKALQLGRVDLATQLWDTGSKVRSNLFDRSMQVADRQFAATGDFNVYRDPFNKYLEDGFNIDNVAQQPDGTYTVTGSSFGQNFSRPGMKREEIVQMIGDARNPGARAQREAALFQKLREADIDAYKEGKVARAKEDAKNPEWKPIVVKDSDGTEHVVMTSNQGGIVGDVSKGQGERLNEKEQSGIRSAVTMLTGGNDPLGDATAEASRTQTRAHATELASLILLRGRQTEGGKQLDPNLAARYAIGIADGSVQTRIQVNPQGQAYVGAMIEGAFVPFRPASADEVAKLGQAGKPAPGQPAKPAPAGAPQKPSPQKPAPSPSLVVAPHAPIQSPTGLPPGLSVPNINSADLYPGASAPSAKGPGLMDAISEAHRASAEYSSNR